MTRQEFKAALHALLAIDEEKFFATGIDPRQWPDFRDDATGFLLGCDDATVERIWVAILQGMETS